MRGEERRRGKNEGRGGRRRRENEGRGGEG